MCKVLKISRTVYYYENKVRKAESNLENAIIKIFKDSRKNYGTRKIKVMLKRQEMIASRRKISKIMAKYGLISTYTKKRYKIHQVTCNNEKVDNVLNRDFNNREQLEVVVSDLTYVNVAGSWNYVCFLLDLHRREIIGYSAGRKKNAELVYKAFTTVNPGLNKIKIFHTDRGNEFKNKIIDELLNAFNIERSLSKKGCPYDNAVAEATFKIFKTEFVNNRRFNSFEELERELFDYVNWYNNLRVHGSLGYSTPTSYNQVSI
jgi:putative transposase